jgi:uncharacterized protein (DUF885 family)
VPSLPAARNRTLSNEPHNAAQQRVAAVFDRLLEHWVATSPVTATQLGDHSRDGELDEWQASTADEQLRVLADLRRDLDGLEAAADGEVAGDAMLLGDAIDAMTFELDVRRHHERDPLFYLGLATGSVHELIRRDDRDAEPLRPAVAARVAQVPRLLDQAQQRLAEVSAPHRQVALLRLPGAEHLFGDVVPAFAPQAAAAAETAVDACRRFGAWLEESSGPEPDWRLGGDQWGGALRLALGVRMTPTELWDRAEAKREELQARMEDLAAEVLGADADGLTGPELVRAGVAAASVDQSEPDNLVRDAAAVLTQIRAFVQDWGEFALPEPDTLRVEEVPPFMQGVAVAYFVPAPPLETNAPHTYYLSPIPASWTEEQTASFLREYNHHALRSVGIHEAYPGHYVQLAFAQRHPRLLRRTLWNSAFAEGWAVYVERQMVAAGFGDADGPQAGARMRLISAKMELRSVANAMLDQALHVHAWTDEEAMALLVDRTYQEPAEAEAKLLRGKVTAGQLSTYFVGGEEMDDLRRDVTMARGAGFSAPDFHADVLAQGTPPFAVLRRAFLGEVTT